MSSNITNYSLVLFVLLGCFYGWVASYFPYHNDIGWHVAAGDWIRASGYVPMTDPWSYTAGDTPWINMAWLWGVLASIIYQYTGLSGVVVLTYAVGLATLCVFAAIAETMNAKRRLILFLAALVAIGFPFYAPPSTFLSIAPGQMTLLFSALLMWILWQDYQSSKVYLLALIPAIFALWINMHGGFILGYAMIGALAGTAFLQGNFRAMFKYGTLLALALSALFLNPYGLGVIKGIFGTIGHDYQRQVHEWQPLYENINIVTGMPALIYTVVFLVTLCKWKHCWRAGYFHMAMLLLSLLLLVHSMLSLRSYSLFLLVSLPVTAYGFSQFKWNNTRFDAWLETFVPAKKIVGGMALVVALCALTFYAKNRDGFTVVDVLSPQKEIHYVLKHHSDTPMMNHWNYGSWVIFEGRGELKPFIDGRLGTAYPGHVFDDFRKFTDGPEYRQDMINKHNIGVIIWPNIDETMTGWLKNNNWRLAYKGKLSGVWVSE